MKIVDLASVAPEGVSHDPAILKCVLLRRGAVPHVMQVARATLMPGQVARDHAHPDMYEIFLCESGDGVAVVDGAEIRLRAGHCIVIEPGERHELRNDGADPFVVTTIAIANEPWKNGKPDGAAAPSGLSF